MPLYLLQSTVLVALTASLFQSFTLIDPKNVPKLTPEAKATAVRFELPLTPLVGTCTGSFTGTANQLPDKGVNDSSFWTALAFASGVMLSKEYPYCEVSGQ